jgi:hypothetical protein
MNLDEFLRSNLRNSYIEEENIEVYVRKSKRRINGELMDFIDVANVHVDEKFRNRGVFTSFLKRLISENSFNIYVESILNSTVERICLKLGFLKINSEYEYELNMYKLSDGK